MARTHSRVVAGLVAGAALALAGCGGGASDLSVAVSDGARFAPASAPAFAEIDTDVDGSQWHTADTLLSRFPGRGDLLADLRKDLAEQGLTWERDVRPALGDALYVSWLDFDRGGDNVVGFAKPRDRSKFEHALESGDEPLEHRDLEGWVVFAESQALIDRFAAARSHGSLADDGVFGDAMDGLSQEALVRVFLGGAAVQQKLDEAIEANGAPKSLTDRFGKLESIAASVSAQENGISFALNFASEGAPEPKSYSPALPDAVPAHPLLFLSFGDVQEGLERILETLDEEVPDFARQRATAELALGFSVEKDLIPLFSKEGGFAIYPGTSEPAYALVLAVDDEGKARSVVDRVAALVELDDEGRARTFTIEGVEVRELTYEGTSVFAAVSQGRLLVTSNEATMRDFLDGGPSLADDAAFRSAKAAAELPDEVTSFAYANLDDGLRELYEYLGDHVPAEVRQNTDPLSSAVFASEQDGDRQRVSGLVEIE